MTRCFRSSYGYGFYLVRTTVPALDALRYQQFRDQQQESQAHGLGGLSVATPQKNGIKMFYHPPEWKLAA